MSIIKTIGQSEFQDGLKGEYFDFTYEATKALYDYYDELSDSDGELYEFDPIAIRCEWSEYDTLAEAYSQYRVYNDTVSKDEMLEYFEDNTQIIELDNGHVLVSEF